MNMGIIIALLAALPQAPPCVEVGMIQLLATPEKYDGKSVCVTGFLHLEFESDALYLHEEDYNHAITQNSLTVETNSEMIKDAAKLNGKYVLLIGEFSSRSEGLTHPPGSIKQIIRCAVWSDPANPKAKAIEALRKKTR